MEAAASVSSTKSRAETASSEFAIGAANPSADAVASPVDREGCPRQRRGPERGDVDALARIGETAPVARGHFDVGEQVMPEGDRLGALQVGEAGHDRVEMFQGLARQRLLIVAQRGIKSVDAIADVEAEVGCDLVVARTRGVQPPGRRPIRSERRASTFMCISSSAAENSKVPFSISDRIVFRP